MNLDLTAPDQPSPEALPPMEEKTPTPVTETSPDYPSCVERLPYLPLKRTSVKPSAQTTPRKKQKQAHDGNAKKMVIFLCLLLLIANICVGAYLILKGGKRPKPGPETPPVRVPEKKIKHAPPPPPRPGDLGMERIQDLRNQQS